MGPCAEVGVYERDADRVKMCSARTMDSRQRLIQVIRAMRTEIRKLELENMGLKRRAGANLRKNATVPIITAESRESVVMTVRRYSVFQPLVRHRDLQLNNVIRERWTGKQQRRQLTCSN